MSLIITNEFSLNMLPNHFTEGAFRIRKVEVAEVNQLIRAHDGYTSYIGHLDMARVVGSHLGIGNSDSLFNRKSYSHSSDDTVVVAQYTGPRLPEGCTSLPEGATITYYAVSSRWGSLYVLDAEELAQGGYCV